MEPVNSNVNIAEKVAEANRKLFQEEEEENVIQAKTTKVQFSDELGYFEPPDFSGEFHLSSNTTIQYQKISNNSIFYQYIIHFKPFQTIEHLSRDSA